MHITIHKIDVQCKLHAWSRAPKASAWDSLEGWGGEGAGGDTCVYLWPIHVDVWRKPSPYCKVISPNK